MDWQWHYFVLSGAVNKTLICYTNANQCGCCSSKISMHNHSSWHLLHRHSDTFKLPVHVCSRTAGLSVFAFNTCTHTRIQKHRGRTQATNCTEKPVTSSSPDTQPGMTHMQTPSSSLEGGSTHTGTHKHSDLTSEMPTDTLGTRGSVWLICCKMFT